ncbi:zinc dependent phospholipase C family protein [Halobacillus sp. GSS1]|uniref:zinc dependent phospholipase C family protein n=1 Tax=Halobacillus sp. GSS1 TaxID=2815919 RepID=UPI001A8D2988|nr:zinc dependent phospholipase C family protein [Halobacillus sp. GSS1]MBN9656358.1 zinc dependent phospholipase C family protein [Halobacillus sp. GSS1]
MPNIWTHILFVDQLCEELDRKDLLETSPASLHMGAQGPDPFFYHNFLPFLPDKEVAEIGMLMHTERCGPFLMDMIERGKSEKNSVQSFILGFVSHHLLDRHTHPYIHYHAGYEENKHQELEVALDTVMLNREKSLKTWKNPVHTKIKMGKQVLPISSFMHGLLDKHYPEVTTKHKKKVIQESFFHIQAAQRVLYDPWKWKNHWFGSLVSSFSHQPINEDKDFLNENRTEWRHSATNEKRNESFLDLYAQAKNEGILLFKYIFEYWKTGSSEVLAHIQKIIGNISYDTGEPLEKMLVNRYSHPIV